jgi:hypothetical protein
MYNIILHFTADGVGYCVHLFHFTFQRSVHFGALAIFHAEVPILMSKMNQSVPFLFFAQPIATLVMSPSSMDGFTRGIQSIRYHLAVVDRH